LLAVHAFNETLHDILPPKHTGIIGSIMSAVDVFTHSGSGAVIPGPDRERLLLEVERTKSG